MTDPIKPAFIEREIPYCDDIHGGTMTADKVRYFDEPGEVTDVIRGLPADKVEALARFMETWLAMSPSTRDATALALTGLQSKKCAAVLGVSNQAVHKAVNKARARCPAIDEVLPPRNKSKGKGPIVDSFSRFFPKTPQSYRAGPLAQIYRKDNADAENDLNAYDPQNTAPDAPSADNFSEETHDHE
jgi:hypothetical protein